MEEEKELDTNSPPFINLVSAFLAMEPPHVLVSLSRDCGGGSITEAVQSFIWEHCINNKTDHTSSAQYIKSFLKKLIIEVESQGSEVLDQLYNQVASYMCSLKDDDSAKGSARVYKYISFIFPDDYAELSSHKSGKLVVPLRCSMNMLEGDTGCTIWPSSLFLSEFILSYPEIFFKRYCFEVGSGVGLVGICLTHVKTSKVMLTDGDLSTLANMKVNLELNQLRISTNLLETAQGSNLVDCIHLPWELAMKNELQDFEPDIILGADVIYDPICLPHLIRVLASLLNRQKASTHIVDNIHRADNSQDQADLNNGPIVEYVLSKLKAGHPIAIIASVIRNINTFDKFRELAENMKLSIEDVTERLKPLNLLPYMKSYDRSSIRLFVITHLC